MQDEAPAGDAGIIRAGCYAAGRSSNDARMQRLTFAAFSLTALLAACDGGEPEAADGVPADAVTLRPTPTGSAGATPDSLIAIAELHDSSGGHLGEARLLQRGTGVVVHVKVTGLEPGLHGIHVHETGRCDASGDFESAGGHLDPEKVTHGLRSPSGGHAGDLPNLDVDADGTGSLRFEATGLSIGTRAGAVFDRDGSALVIHAEPDDQTTDPSGNSGDRIACGVFERT